MLVIHTPRLCGEAIFVGGAGSAEDAASEKRKKAVSIVECRPVVKDEMLLLAQSDTRAVQPETTESEVMTEPIQPKVDAQVGMLDPIQLRHPTQNTALFISRSLLLNKN